MECFILPNSRTYNRVRLKKKRKKLQKKKKNLQKDLEKAERDEHLNVNGVRWNNRVET